MKRPNAPCFAFGAMLLLHWLAPGIAIGAATQRILANLELPVFVTGGRHADRDLLFVVEQAGRIEVMVDGALQAEPFLDIEDWVIDLESYDERGLLGLALHPSFETNGRCFVVYVDPANRTHITRLDLLSETPLRANRGSAQQLLIVTPPGQNHRGGWLGFGADGFLYIALGDGTGTMAPNHPSQRGDSYLGKVLRIDVHQGTPYAIPADNPFVGNPQFLDEIWSYGWRNPWRCSFDRETGDWWGADVGYLSWEEVNFEANADPGGANYGWRLMEGMHCFLPPEDCNDGTLRLPIYEYSHSAGCSVTGGYVYRGFALPEFYGHYFFADFCSAKILSFRYENDMILDLTDRTADLAPGGGLQIEFIASFGEDANGELYIVDRGTGSDGEVYKVTPELTSLPGGGSLSAEVPLEVRRIGQHPIQGGGAWNVSLLRTASVRARILDLQGRTLSSLLDRELAAGTHLLRWDGTILGRSAPAGMYHLVVETPENSLAQRVVVVR